MSISPKALQQQPLTIAQPTPTHYRPSQALVRVSRRASESEHVPRPRNAFIIFRCERLPKLHTKDAVSSDRPPTPEKTLSKRAGAAWRQLPESEKQIYKALAEKERLEHQLKYPGYRYQPNRSKSSKPRSSGPLSRRERVESLLMRAASSGTHNSLSADSDESPSPASERSGSPEPPEVPFSADTSDHGLAHRRSMSLPHLDIDNPQEPYSFSRTYFIEPTSCMSSPGPGPHRNSRRSSNARNRSYSPAVATVPPPDCAFDLDYGTTTVPFSSLAPHTSTLSLPELLTFSECLALSDSADSSGYSTPQTSPAPSVHEPNPEYFPGQAQAQTSAGSLYSRRQRSNTAPSAFLSPLSAMSSSMGQWNSTFTATAAATAGLPSFTVSAPENVANTPTSSSLPLTASPLTDGTVPYGEFFAQNRNELCTADRDLDMERTPRRADFPPNVQDQYPPPPYSMTTIDMPFTGQCEYDLQSYAVGLGDLNISAPPYEMSSMSMSEELSPFEDLDFSEFLSVGNY